MLVVLPSHIQVWLLLFNDLLLITRKDGKIFTVHEEPILLDDLKLLDVQGASMEMLTTTVHVLLLC